MWSATYGGSTTMSQITSKIFKDRNFDEGAIQKLVDPRQYYDSCRTPFSV